MSEPVDLERLKAQIEACRSKGRFECWIFEADAILAEFTEAQHKLAFLCNSLRELMDMHPGCVNCMKAETTVEPGKYCPDCGRQQQEKP